MSTKIIIHCDKCDSTEVLHEQIPVDIQEEHKTMQQIVDSSKKPEMSYDVYWHTHYRMVCKSCGHIVTYHK